ncbi:DUF4282 domain-containing protein [Georgenia sp. Z1344]|uniref:DUF4282 domain-containing protein n=1 Tax=Georgenia sp. Z1344 TaxID=3416706 RepID=UPI003CE8E06B
MSHHPPEPLGHHPGQPDDQHQDSGLHSAQSPGTGQYAVHPSAPSPGGHGGYGPPGGYGGPGGPGRAGGPPGVGDPYRATAPADAAKGFFAKLFDLSFNDFITLTFAKIIYVLVIGIAAIGWLMLVVTGFATGEAMLGILALLLGWVPALLYLVLVRVGLESAIALIRTAQNTTDMVRRA